MRYAALLRGINVGGKNKLPMNALAAMFTAAGCSGVVTYIQSGNVVFEAPSKLVKSLPLLIPAANAEQFGIRAPLTIRSAAEWEQVLLNKPFPEVHGVAFLADLPSAKAVTSLDPNRSPGDRFELNGREIYMHLTAGFAKTKLTSAWMDSKLATVSTVRNWATVCKLSELLSGR